MIRFWLASKPAPGDSLDNFDYQWGVVHVALMLTTRSVMSNFRRYVQHRVPPALDVQPSQYARSERAWYSISDHIVDGVDNITHIFREGEYSRRMQPHKFGSTEFAIELTDLGETMFERDVAPPGTGQVKLVNFIRKAEGVGHDEFVAWWHEKYAAETVGYAERSGMIQRYIQSSQLPLDAQVFQGTLFEAGGVQTYSGIEEIYFDSVEAYQRYAQENRPEGGNRDVDLIDTVRSFSMPTVERVVFDFLSDGPAPSVVDPSSLEYRVSTHEPWPGRWNEV